MQVRRFAAAGLTLTALTGCASMGVQSKVTTFHQLTAADAGTFVIFPWRKENEGSLEFATYANQVAASLETKGYKRAPEAEAGKYIVMLDYGIDDGRIETTSYSIPQYGVTGYSGSTTSGTVSTFGNTSYVDATTSGTPVYGAKEYIPASTSTTIYRRFVSVDIIDGAALGPDGKPKRLYEGRLRSEGSCGNLPTVMPVLVQAMFQEFPGTSGTARTASVPLPGKC
jgi:hypothetical protein